MKKEDIKYIEDYLEWIRQNMNPAQVDFEQFANGMMNCNKILGQALSLHNVVGQSEQLKCHHQYMNAGTLQGEAMKKCLKCGDYVKAL